MTELSTNSIRVLDIKLGTSVDGPGLRTSIYCAGCNNRCPGCHNPQSWDEMAGESVLVDDLFAQIVRERMNVTFSGGDPMLHPEGFTELARRIKQDTSLSIWCYTGYRFEDILQHPGRRALAVLCDVIVDGPFMMSQKDSSLRFRGSANQRISDVQRSLDGTICLLEF